MMAGNLAVNEELTIDACMEGLDDMMAFVDGHIEEYGCSPRVQTQIDVAVEEVFVNIASYAYTPDTGPATVRLEINDEVIIITFIDSGTPYDPPRRYSTRRGQAHRRTGNFSGQKEHGQCII